MPNPSFHRTLRDKVAQRLSIQTLERMDTNNWLKFANICRETFCECTFQEELIAECGSNEDIAWAAFFHLCGDSLSWLYRNVPALDGAKPIELIRSGDTDQVRECLWGMPC